MLYTEYTFTVHFTHLSIMQADPIDCSVCKIFFL